LSLPGRNVCIQHESLLGCSDLNLVCDFLSVSSEGSPGKQRSIPHLRKQLSSYLPTNHFLENPFRIGDGGDDVRFQAFSKLQWIVLSSDMNASLPTACLCRQAIGVLEGYGGDVTPQSEREVIT
jgi:hypothetical protein